MKNHELNQFEIKGGPYKLESSFTTAWLKEIRKKYWAYKISDGSIGNKPFDCIIAVKDNIYVCEIKVIKKDVFSVNRLRPSQWKALRKVHELNPGKAIVCVYSTEYNCYKIIPFEIIDSINKDGRIKLTFN